MVRNEQYFIDELKKDNCYEIFMCIAKCSAKYISKSRWVTTTPVDEEIVFRAINEKFLKSKELIENDINRLISIGLIEYVSKDKNPYRNNATDDEDAERMIFYNKKDMSIEERKICLTTDMQISGRNLYLKICSKDEEDENLKKSSENIKKLMQEMFNDLYEPHQEEINKMQNEIKLHMDKAEKTYENIEKNLGDSIIKNIQVLSVFAGIIAILFSNIIAIKEMATGGIFKTIIILDLSIIVVSFFMLIFTRLIIINKDKKSLYISVFLFVITLILLLLFM